MTMAAQEVIAAFNALDSSEQHEVAVEILRRSSTTNGLSDEAFDEIAAEVFRAYDAEEASSADS